MMANRNAKSRPTKQPTGRCKQSAPAAKSRAQHQKGNTQASNRCSTAPASARVGKPQHQQGNPNASKRSLAAPTLAAVGRPQQQKGNTQASNHSLTAPAVGKPQHQKLNPQATKRSFAVPASATVGKPQHQKGNLQASNRSFALPASAAVGKPQHQKGNLQASNHSFALPVSAAVGKPQHQKGNPQATNRSFALPASAAVGKPQHQKGNPQATNRSIAVPAPAAVGKPQHQKGNPQATNRSFAVPAPAAVGKRQHKKGNHQASNCSLTATASAAVCKPQHPKGNPQASTCSLAAPASAAQHQKGNPNASKRSLAAPTSAAVGKPQHPKGNPQASNCSLTVPASIAVGKTQHQKGNTKNQTDLLRSTRKKNIDEFFASKIDIDRDEKKASVKVVNGVLSKVMSHVNRQDGGDIYCPNHVKAGSYPVNTKIGKANEFDTNICLKLGQKDVNVRRDGKINYAYSQNGHSTNMNVKCQLDKTKKGFKIPDGMVVASTRASKIPETLRHGDDMLPWEMRYDLYHKIKTAINDLHLNHVHLSRESHGPALTMTIQPHKHSTIRHDISVDVTLSLPCDVPVNNWPRKETRKAFSERLINDVKETGTHLVPKKDELWSVSYSRAERELFSKIDEGNGCRKFVYKVLKKHLQTCKSRSSNDLPGLSSHILKTQLLWSCEKHTTNGYWNHGNRDLCLIDSMTDLEKTLRNGRLPDYFDKKVDTLKGKDSAVLVELADYLHGEKCKLEQQ